VAGNRTFKAGDWLVEPSLDRVSLGDDVRTLRPQVMELLVYLAERPSDVVSTDQLLEDLWDGRIVSEGSVYNCVGELRSALVRDDETEPAIQTVPKKGYRLVLPVSLDEPADSADIAGPGRRTIPVIVAAGVALAVVAAIIVWFQKPTPSADTIRALVVLPFDNHSPEPARDEFFADGMTETLIGRLSRIDELRVISRTSSMQIKNSGLSIPDIARSLDVDGVVEGSIMTVDREVRLTLQLIDGRTDTHLWSNSYVRDRDDILALQTEIANEIATELSAVLGTTEFVVRPAAQPTISSEAYRAYWRARYSFSSFGAEEFRRALEFYSVAIELDPEFALAYASRAEACNQPLVINSGMRTLDECADDARRAIELNPDLAEAHAALGYVQLIQWHWQASQRNLEYAIQLNPNSAMARQWYALTLLVGRRFDDALAEIRRAEALDPLNLFTRTMVGWPLYNQRRYEAALEQWDDVLEMDPGFMLAHYNRGVAYIELRDAEQVFASANAVATIGGEQLLETRLLKASAHAIRGEREATLDLLAGIERDAGQLMAAWIASIYLMMGDENAALSRLERGVADHAPDMFSIIEPKFDPVREHPRFQAIRLAMDLPNSP
jgi:TolB-like protein/DNA-binding winged helix-turn-helix (wHTH) protein/tetratricopeptide (TPR) repeat protein